ncbi:hypothetical protein CEXT_82041, partial [Caerostris extrusa]
DNIAPRHQMLMMPSSQVVTKFDPLSVEARCAMVSVACMVQVPWPRKLIGWSIGTPRRGSAISTSHCSSS